MKFGKTLYSNQIPEWSKNYVAYKALKHVIGDAAQHLPLSEEATTAILFQLDRELEKVDTFYNYKQSQIDRRLWILSERYQQWCVAEEAARHESSDDLASVHSTDQELSGALQELKAQMMKIMRFAELNAKGFRKILKKMDKKLGLESQHVYWQTKVAILPFASQDQLRSEIDKLTHWIANLNLSDQHVTSRHTVPSLIKSASRTSSPTMNVARLLAENSPVVESITSDAVEQLKELFTKGEHPLDHRQGAIALLELALQKDAVQCVQYLVENMPPETVGHCDINERNVVHKISISVGTKHTPETIPLRAVQQLLTLAPHLGYAKDFSARQPLHYACEYGQTEFARLLLAHAIQNNYWTSLGFADPRWQDREGHTPFFLAILHGKPETLGALIETGNVSEIDSVISVSSRNHGNTTAGTSGTAGTAGTMLASDTDAIPDFARPFHHPSAIAMACNMQNLDLLSLLIDKGASVDLADDDGETALFLAVRGHFVEGVRMLISKGHANVDQTERINGWTPLIVAAIEGQTEIARLLLDAGASKSKVDLAGWAAYEHAVFRGYLELGRLTKPENNAHVESVARTKLVDTDTKPTNGHTNKARSRASRLYGHKYLTDQSMIIITLGSNDVRNPLSRCFLNLADGGADDRRLSIAVSATGATGDFPIFDLPPNNQHQLLHPEPIVLFTTKPEAVVLRFDLVETFGPPSSNNIIARGTSFLASDQIYKRSNGFKGNVAETSSLRGQHTVPLMQASNLECIGSLGFEYIVVHPFTHPRMKVGDRYTYYKSVDTKVIGHRGSGMNQRSSFLQVGENTMLSFITAASLGAEYIEFDVQLTKDLVPVVYHDWTVTETGYDIPLNAITLEQFLNLRPSGHIKEYHTGVSNGPHGELLSTTNGHAESQMSPPCVSETDHLSPPSPQSRRMNRSRSVSSIEMQSREFASRRLDLTRTTKLGKLKGNGPETIQAPFTTLAEALKKIPKSAGCNIEVKYPMIDEAEGEELHQFQELNVFVDTILNCVYDNAEEDRRIIFSSFHPEICLALNLKQPNYPVFFLTDAGTLPMADIRCNSLQGAVRFAKQADLLGIVTASEPILEAPRMTRVIKESGLLLFTYGALNNIVSNAVAQKSFGVDAVIVDSVLAVTKGLNSGRSKENQEREKEAQIPLYQ